MTEPWQDEIRRKYTQATEGRDAADGHVNVRQNSFKCLTKLSTLNSMVTSIVALVAVAYVRRRFVSTTDARFIKVRNLVNRVCS